MNRYIRIYLISGLAVTIPSLLLFYGAISSYNLTQLTVLTIIFSILWFPYFLLKHGNGKGLNISIIALAVLWAPIFYQVVGRIVFVRTHGGFEGSNGEGSPLAFLIGATIELYLFTFLSLALVAGIRCRVKARRSGR